MSIKFAALPPLYNKCCAKCEHCITYNRAAFQYECEAPENVDMLTVDVVTGYPLMKHMNCYDTREDEVAGCGREGKWWVLKESRELVPAVRVEKLAAKNQSASVDDLGL